MMLFVRLYPRYDVDKVWSYTEKRLSKYRGNSVVPLFMSQHDYQNFVSVILDVYDGEALIDFLAEEIAPCDEIAYTRTITLIKPAFYLVPEKVTSQVYRWRVAIRVDPALYREVYDKLLRLEPPKKVHYAYITYSFGEDDILISLISDKKEAIRKFVSEKIEKIKGVLGVNILLTHRTKRLANENTWRAFERKFAASRFISSAKTAGEDGFDWTFMEHCAIHGALPDED